MSKVRFLSAVAAGVAAGLAIAVACVSPSADEPAASACREWEVKTQEILIAGTPVKMGQGWEPFASILDPFDPTPHAVLRRCVD